MTIDDDHFTFEPDTARLQPVITQLQEVKLQDNPHPDGSLSIQHQMAVFQRCLVETMTRTCAMISRA